MFRTAKKLTIVLVDDRLFDYRLRMGSFARMQAFVRVAECGGFTAAAQRLGRSKALLSKQVRELEDELGVRLINRTTRQLSLTEAGQVYLREAVDILQRVDDLDSLVRDTHREARGQLRVTAPRTLGDGDLGRAVMEFLRREPLIGLELSLDDRFVDLVEEGFDVAIRVTDLADSSFIARKLAGFRIAVVARPDLVAATGEPKLPCELADLPCIVDANARTRGNWSFLVDGERVTVSVNGRIESNSPHACRLAALAGLGYAFVPMTLVRDDVAAGRLVTVLSEYEDERRGIYAIYPHKRHLSGKVRAFVDFLVQWFDGPWETRADRPAADVAPAGDLSAVRLSSATVASPPSTPASAAERRFAPVDR